MSGIEGKVVAITGAGSGIGEATALLLAERGARVVLGARRAERLEALAARIEKAGGEAAWVRTDVTRRADLSGLVRLARERYGKLDVLVSNAGVGLISPGRPPRRGLGGDDRRQPQRRAVRDRRSSAGLPGAGLRALRQHRVHRRTARHPLQSVYAATKNAVRTLSEGLRQEAGEGLRVTVVSPGFVRTDFADRMDSR